MPLESQPDSDQSPARGGTLLALWVLSLLMAVFSVLFGFWPWLLCRLKGEDLTALAAGELDPTGRRLTSTGRRLAIVGVLGFALVLGAALFWLSKPR